MQYREKNAASYYDVGEMRKRNESKNKTKNKYNTFKI